MFHLEVEQAKTEYGWYCERAKNDLVALYYAADAAHALDDDDDDDHG